MSGPHLVDRSSGICIYCHCGGFPPTTECPGRATATPPDKDDGPTWSDRDGLLDRAQAAEKRAEAAERAVAELRDRIDEGFPTSALPDDLRALGWSVAVHNDYRIDGEPHTFWLLTKDGQALKGEGKTDWRALNQIRAQVVPAATGKAPQPSPGGTEERTAIGDGPTASTATQPDNAADVANFAMMLADNMREK